MKKQSSLTEVVDEILRTLGNRVVMATPLGAGKPNTLINEIYQRAKNDSTIQLTICTALTLEKPEGKSDLEKRFLRPMVERVFADYPDLQFEKDRKENKVPSNIKLLEFYYPPGKYLNNSLAQRSYISSNFTHAARDILDRDVNLICQMVAEEDGLFSLSCNCDMTKDIIRGMKKKDYPSIKVYQVNENLPFMYGDAILEKDQIDIIYDNPKDYYKIFGPPKMSITDADFMIGLYSSSLVKDDGELQVGIGSLGDAVIYGLCLKQEENQSYNEILKDLGFLERFKEVLSAKGSLETFKKGLFGATEMLVDGFMELYQRGILKKKVYDNVVIQRMINEGNLDPENLNFNNIISLYQQKVIHSPLNESDFEFLKYWGFIKRECNYRKISLQETSDINELSTKLMGRKLRNGHLAHGGFFLGPEKFYRWLKSLDPEERKLFSMRSVSKINQLYGHEELDRLHRRNARFINTCMMTTLGGAHVSDGIYTNQVVSGIGGQFNFVAMAQELPDGHSVLTMRATRFSRGKLVSNIVPYYGHISVPRHMRDILVTEYGVADLRGKTDEEIVIELLKVCDSRFQEELLQYAKSKKKVSENYKIPAEYKGNSPKSYQIILSKWKKRGLFSKFPFGTDLTDEEIQIGGALKRVKARMEKGIFSKLLFILKALMLRPTEDKRKLLERINLKNPRGAKEILYQRIVAAEL